jgi:hypothetical protein
VLVAGFDAVVTNLDGTVIRRDGTVSQATLDAARALPLASDLWVTGRPVRPPDDRQCTLIKQLRTFSASVGRSPAATSGDLLHARTAA